MRFRELPLTPERVRAGLGIEPTPAPPKRRRWFGALAGAFTGALGMAAVVLPWRPAYAPIARPDPSVFSATTIERGRLVAAAGACAVCHTGPGRGSVRRRPGARHPVRPDLVQQIFRPMPQSGIGAWSYPAFERAMREGISRDGHHLYPAHPYTSFSRVSDADLQAL